MGAWIPLPEPTRSGQRVWIDPYPGELPDDDPGPEARYEARESMSLVFVTALQHLPPRQRAALILSDVLGFRAAETADILDCGTEAAGTLLRAARATIDENLPSGGRDAPPPDSAREHEVVAAFADAFERGDTPAIVRILTDDAWLTMPPRPFEYQGPDKIGRVLDVVFFRHGAQRNRLVPTRANGQPAFGRYAGDPGRAHGMIVLTLTGDRISAITGFLDNRVLAHFGLPLTPPD